MIISLKPKIFHLHLPWGRWHVHSDVVDVFFTLHFLFAEFGDQDMIELSNLSKTNQTFTTYPSVHHFSQHSHTRTRTTPKWLLMYKTKGVIIIQR